MEPTAITSRSISSSDSTPKAYLRTILEGIGEGFYAVDEAWRITEFNTQAEHHFSRSAASVVGRVLWDVFPGARETTLGQIFLRAMATREPVVSEAQSVLFANRWLSYRLFPLEQGLGVVFRDITDRKNAEDQRDLLVRELYHRVNNTLATVHAIAAQTFGGGEPLAAFSARLQALSNAHSILAKENWDGAPLLNIIHLSLEPYRTPGTDRFSVEGSNLRFDAKAILAVSMAVHELCTNAAKYGALSRPNGSVAIGWRVCGDRFIFTWRETGGPAVTPPARRGFGTAMIERVLAIQLDARVKIDFFVSGLVCTIDAPLARVQETGPAPGIVRG